MSDQKIREIQFALSTDCDKEIFGETARFYGRANQCESNSRLSEQDNCAGAHLLNDGRARQPTEVDAKPMFNASAKSFQRHREFSSANAFQNTTEDPFKSQNRSDVKYSANSVVVDNQGDEAHETDSTGGNSEQDSVDRAASGIHKARAHVSNYNPYSEHFCYPLDQDSRSDEIYRVKSRYANPPYFSLAYFTPAAIDKLIKLATSSHPIFGERWTPKLMKSYLQFTFIRLIEQERLIVLFANARAAITAKHLGVSQWSLLMNTGLQRSDSNESIYLCMIQQQLSNTYDNKQPYISLCSHIWTQNDAEFKEYMTLASSGRADVYVRPAGLAYLGKSSIAPKIYVWQGYPQSATFFEPRDPRLLFDSSAEIRQDMIASHICTERLERLIECGIVDAAEGWVVEASQLECLSGFDRERDVTFEMLNDSQWLSIDASMKGAPCWQFGVAHVHYPNANKRSDAHITGTGGRANPNVTSPGRLLPSRGLPVFRPGDTGRWYPAFRRVYDPSVRRHRWMLCRQSESGGKIEFHFMRRSLSATILQKQFQHYIERSVLYARQNMFLAVPQMYYSVNGYSKQYKCSAIVGHLQLLLPLFDEDGKPLAALSLQEVNRSDRLIYEIGTLFTLPMAYFNARLLGRVDNPWLRHVADQLSDDQLELIDD